MLILLTFSVLLCIAACCCVFRVVGFVDCVVVGCGDVGVDVVDTIAAIAVVVGVMFVVVLTIRVATMVLTLMALLFVSIVLLPSVL